MRKNLRIKFEDTSNKSTITKVEEDDILERVFASIIAREKDAYDNEEVKVK
ncbi:hypothetical protein ACJ2A9_13475 [Anaerobacillus sp. MEB173]|uniref:hypothetical protein n=1 Tax=Anaerobacillus sp. MEB173 TaxID=3383345 RepID=UPI003F8DEE0F